MTIGSSMSYDTSYVKARKKAMRHLKLSNAQQLEIETKKMEDRIRALKEQMVREKEERERLGGTRWTSGKTGPLNSHAQDILMKKTSKSEKPRRKIKILGDEPIQSYLRKSTPKVQQLEGSVGSGCGQCEKTRATVVCIECSEKYCVSCFMSFHQKGALKKHNTKAIDLYEKEQSQEKEMHEKMTTTTVTRITNPIQARSPQADDSPGQRGGALLQGSYNEEESAQSFAEALKAWRGRDQEEKLWTNPAFTKGSLRDSSTTPEPTKPVDLKLTFGPNKSLSYLDRMLLKKHQNYPERLSQPQPPKGVKQNTIQVSPSSKDSNDSPRLYSELGFNYREIFQNLGASSAKSTPDGASFAIHPKNGVVIEEVNENEQLSGEENSSCVVEEDTSPHPRVGPMSQLGRVSIMCMTPTGNFEADSHALQLEDVSSVSSTRNSPVSKSSSVARLGESESVLLLENSNINTIKAREQSKTSTGRVWSPKPCFVGLSEFFLAGVETSQGRTTTGSPRPVQPETLSKTLLAQNVWKPQESFCVNGEVTESASDVRTESPQPIIPLVHEPSLLSLNADSPDSRSTPVVANLDSDTQFVDQEQIHDFGIVDFLKAPPCLTIGYDDYRHAHRVSTVSPLTLSPNPPNLHWSDDSDDDFMLEQICSDTSQDEQRANQDADDRATLNHLAWELASTTGRLTHCEIHDEETEGEDDFDDDSIESNDRGSGLSSSEEDTSTDTYSANSESKKDNTLAQEEVHALK